MKYKALVDIETFGEVTIILRKDKIIYIFQGLLLF